MPVGRKKYDKTKFKQNYKSKRGGLGSPLFLLWQAFRGFGDFLQSVSQKGRSGFWVKKRD
jgi:hypothetical protein